MELYKQIISRFPRGGLSYAFAYGSGVKHQLGYDKKDKQKDNVIDLAFCVRDPLGWHAENISRHPDDYSALKQLGPEFIMRYQEKLGAKVFCNTLVPLPKYGVTIKYGVVTREHLIDDLLNWRHLYMAGRLQKTVCDLIDPVHDEKLTAALHKNLYSALQVALLLLPENFSSFQLFYAISSLSYKGDFRMIFGENKQKVYNIVSAQEEELFQLYQPILAKLSKYVAMNKSAKELGTKRLVTQFEQDKSERALQCHLQNVPDELRKRIVRNAACRGTYLEIVEHLSKTKNLSEVVQVSVNDIVWRSSITQSLKNIPTAGIFKSVIYSYRKAIKTFAH